MKILEFLGVKFQFNITFLKADEKNQKWFLKTLKADRVEINIFIIGNKLKKKSQNKEKVRYLMKKNKRYNL